MDEKKEAIPKSMVKIGKISFIVGMIIALLSGLYIGYTGEGLNKFVISLLIILGFIIGLINVTQKETVPYIVAVISIFLVLSLGGDFLKVVDTFGPYFDGILKSMMILFIPSMIIVALKIIWDYAVDV
jgi:hypothetical protein